MNCCEFESSYYEKILFPSDDSLTFYPLCVVFLVQNVNHFNILMPRKTLSKVMTVKDIPNIALSFLQLLPTQVEKLTKNNLHLQSCSAKTRRFCIVLQILHLRTTQKNKNQNRISNLNVPKFIMPKCPVLQVPFAVKIILVNMILILLILLRVTTNIITFCAHTGYQQQAMNILFAINLQLQMNWKIYFYS